MAETLWEADGLLFGVNLGKQAYAGLRFEPFVNWRLLAGLAEVGVDLLADAKLRLYQD